MKGGSCITRLPALAYRPKWDREPLVDSLYVSWIAGRWESLTFKTAARMLQAIPIRSLAGKNRFGSRRWGMTALVISFGPEVVLIRSAGMGIRANGRTGFSSSFRIPGAAISLRPTSPALPVPLPTIRVSRRGMTSGSHCILLRPILPSTAKN